jgi:DNA-directed RNA polymerase sigma subunit (sigma70/sigma32)
LILAADALSSPAWLREGDIATLGDPAVKFEVSAERIRQTEFQALQKMRKVINLQGVAP